jgi:hypothetical protein
MNYRRVTIRACARLSKGEADIDWRHTLRIGYFPGQVEFAVILRPNRAILLRPFRLGVLIHEHLNDDKYNFAAGLDVTL